MRLGHYIQKGIDFFIGGDAPTAPADASGKSAGDEPDIYGLLEKINELKKEMSGGYLFKDESASRSVLPEPAKTKQDEIDFMLKELPFDLRFSCFTEYGDYAELWSLKGGELYFETKKKDKSLSNKYGLASISERPGWEEIRLREGEADTDILYINNWGQFKVCLKFPEIAELMKDTLSPSSPPGMK